MFIRILLLIMRLVNPMCNAIGRTDAPGFLLPPERHRKRATRRVAPTRRDPPKADTTLHKMAGQSRTYGMLCRYDGLGYRRGRLYHRLWLDFYYGASFLGRTPLRFWAQSASGGCPYHSVTVRLPRRPASGGLLAMTYIGVPGFLLPQE